MGEFCSELEVAADEALMAEAGREEVAAIGKDVWTWLGFNGRRAGGRGGCAASILGVVGGEGDGGEARIDMMMEERRASLLQRGERSSNAATQPRRPAYMGRGTEIRRGGAGRWLDASLQRVCLPAGGGRDGEGGGATVEEGRTEDAGSDAVRGAYRQVVSRGRRRLLHPAERSQMQPASSGRWSVAAGGRRGGKGGGLILPQRPAG